MLHRLTDVLILVILFQVANFLQGQLPFDLVPVSGFQIHFLDVCLDCHSRVAEIGTFVLHLANVKFYQ